MSDKREEKALLLDPEAQFYEAAAPPQVEPARTDVWRRMKVLVRLFAVYLVYRILFVAICLSFKPKEHAEGGTSWVMTALGQLRKSRADNEALYLYVSPCLHTGKIRDG